MRRKDREMTKEFGLKIIDKSNYGTVLMVGEDIKPYGVPLSIARDEEILYFHSAKEGKKVEIFNKNPAVSVVFIGEVKIPENYTKEEMDEMVKSESGVQQLLSNIFTTEFESAIVTGKVELIEDEDEKAKAMRIICEKYTPTKKDYFDEAIKSGLPDANLYRIKIEKITSKRKKYDEDGKEMKWGRM